MVVHKKVPEEMASTSINQLLKSKLNLNSQILSKNTNEMVSTCIEKLYKQTPIKFKNDLQQIKIASAKIENPAPVRIWKNQELQHQQNARIEQRFRPTLATSIDETDLLQSVMKTSRKQQSSNITASKRLLKSPNYKIYSSRRYGSSASSSSGSLFRRMDERRRSAHFPTSHAITQLKKSYAMLHGYKAKPQFSVKSNVASKEGVPARNQHMSSQISSLPKATEVSSNIQKDLLVIDNILKQRMRAPKSKVNTTKPSNVWHYSPALEVYNSRNEQRIANAELQQQYKRLQKISDMKPLGTYKQMEEVSSANPALSSKIIRKHFANFFTDNQQPLPYSSSPRANDSSSAMEYFAQRKPLSEVQASYILGAKENDYKSSPSMSEYNFKSKSHKPNKLYKINGRIASPTIASLTNAAASVTPGRYNRIKYLNLSSLHGVKQQ